MADRKRQDPGVQLEELNDQLARFLQHADQLLEDWARFGAQVRATVDQEVGRIEQAAAEAADRATRQLGARVDKIAHERVERAVGDGLARFKVELDRAGRGTATAAPAAPPPNRALVGAVVLANLLLVSLLLVTIFGGSGGGSTTRATGVDGVDTVDAGPRPDLIDACLGLASAWSDDHAVTVMQAGTAACGTHASAVEAVLRARLLGAAPVVDGGPIDAGPPTDAKPKRSN